MILSLPRISFESLDVANRGGENYQSSGSRYEVNISFIVLLIPAIPLPLSNKFTHC